MKKLKRFYRCHKGAIILCVIYILITHIFFRDYSLLGVTFLLALLLLVLYWRWRLTFKPSPPKRDWEE